MTWRFQLPKGWEFRCHTVAPFAYFFSFLFNGNRFEYLLWEWLNRNSTSFLLSAWAHLHVACRDFSYVVLDRGPLITKTDCNEKLYFFIPTKELYYLKDHYVLNLFILLSSRSGKRVVEQWLIVNHGRQISKKIQGWTMRCEDGFSSDKIVLLPPALRDRIWAESTLLIHWKCFAHTPECIIEIQ